MSRADSTTAALTGLVICSMIFTFSSMRVMEQARGVGDNYYITYMSPVPRIPICESDVDKRPLEMQISREQALMICYALRRPESKGNFLVFSLGFDSAFWKNIMNPDGVTIFLEDVPEWYNKVVTQHPDLEGAASLVHYTTDAANWEADLKLLEGPGSGSWFRIRDLPSAVTNRSGEWDTILVDAPMGTPKGRLQSIYEASKLIKKGGVIIIDDCQREPEKQASQVILGNNAGGVLKMSVSRGGLAGNSQCLWKMP